MNRLYFLLIATVLLLVAGICLTHVSVSHAHTSMNSTISNDITTDTIWKQAHSPYIIQKSITISKGITLTIEPGVTVKAKSGSWIKIQGNLQAIGTATNPITFTSELDTGPEEWAGLLFDGSQGGGMAHLAYVTVRYGGQSHGVAHSNISVVDVQQGKVFIEHSRISNEQARGFIGNNDQVDYGLYIKGSKVVVQHTLFTENGNTSIDYPIYVTEHTSVLQLDNNTFAENQKNRVLISNDARISADVAQTDIVFTPQLGLEGYELQVGYSYTVPAGKTMVVEPGTTIMGQTVAFQTSSILIQGNLQATGTLTQPVIFTSSLDSNGEQWAGLFFDGSQGEGSGELRYVTVRCAGAGGPSSAISVQNVQGTRQVLIANSTIAQSFRRGNIGVDAADYSLNIENSNVTVSNTTFLQNGNSAYDYVIRTRGDTTQLVINKSTFEKNQKGIRIDGGNVTMTCSIFQNHLTNNALENNTIPSIKAMRNWWGDPTGPRHPTNPNGTGYTLTGNVTFVPWLTEMVCKENLYLPMVGK